jgi:hypothetical protein
MPTVLIVEPYPNLATPVQEVCALANCEPVTVTGCDAFDRLPRTPVAIVLRVTTNQVFQSPHHDLEKIPREGRPPIVALVGSDQDVVEAERLGCDLLLRTPGQMQALYDALMLIRKQRG